MSTKVFNLTDVETPALKQKGLVGHHFAVGDQMLAPGESCDVDDETLERVRPQLQEMVTQGLLSFDEVTKDYEAAKTKASQDKEKDAQPADASASPKAKTPSKLPPQPADKKDG